MTSRPRRIAVVEPAPGLGTVLAADFDQARMVGPTEIDEVLREGAAAFGCVGIAGFTDPDDLRSAVDAVHAALAAAAEVVVLVDRAQPVDTLTPSPPAQLLGSARVSGRSCLVLARDRRAATWLALEPADAPLPDPDPLAALVPHTRQLDARIAAAETERDRLAERLRLAEEKLAATARRRDELTAELARARQHPGARLHAWLRAGARGRRGAAAAAAALVVAALAVLAGVLSADVAAGLVTALLLVLVPAAAYLVLAVRRIGRSVGRVGDRLAAVQSAAAGDRARLRGQLDWVQQALRNNAERGARLERKTEIIAATTVDAAHLLGSLRDPQPGAETDAPGTEELLG